MGNEQTPQNETEAPGAASGGNCGLGHTLNVIGILRNLERQSE